MNNNSFWRETNSRSNFIKLTENINTDILIIGAGITGLAVAYELLNYSKDIVIVDQNKIYQNTTSSTTAKVTAQHGYIYHKLIKMHGLKKAKAYYNFNAIGLKRIIDIVEKEKIKCDLNIVNSYLFSLSDLENSNIKREEIAYKRLNINYYHENISYNITKNKALKINNQANFNITKYLNELTNILEKENVRFFENTKIITTNNDSNLYALTEDNLYINANKIIICSHYPIYKSVNFYFLKMIPQISYAVVGEINQDFEDANYINTDKDNIFALRFLNINNKKHLIISGQTHEAKKFISYDENINKLKEFGTKHFGINKYIYSWTGQDYHSTDNIPYIGRVDKNIYLAVGFNEWGMSTSHAASILIRDLIVENYHPYEHVFNPKRSKPTFKLLAYNATMLNTLIKTRIIKSPKDIIIKPNNGIVIRLNNTPVGIFKDENNKLFVLKAICPHLRCGLRFNNVDKTFDCKCHGSRFTYTGKKIDGPAKSDLEIIDTFNLFSI